MASWSLSRNASSTVAWNRRSSSSSSWRSGRTVTPGAGFGVYRKLRVRVHTLDGDALAWVYVLDGYEGGLPSARYLGVLAEAAENAGAPDDYVAELRARPCRSVSPGR